MMKTFAFVSLVISVVAAQTSTSISSAATPSSTANPLIPASISTSCANFLNNLDTDSTLQGCLGPINSATAAFGPSANSTNGTDVTYALAQLCDSPSSGCDVTSIRTLLANFYQSCTNEILDSSSDSNQQVAEIYDFLFALVPLTSAMCSHDENGNSCISSVQSSLNSTSSTSSSTASPSEAVRIAVPGSSNSSLLDLLENYLYTSVPNGIAPIKRDVTTVVSNDTTLLKPNTTTFAASNLAFLFLQASTSEFTLCGACALSIMTSYVEFESQVPYAAGVAKSPILAGQPALYQAMTSKCGTQFLGSTVQAAGGLSGGLASGAVKDITIRFPAMLGTLIVLFAGVFIFNDLL